MVAQSGFNYFSDRLTDRDYARLAYWVDRYWPYGGAGGDHNFIRFIGFVKSMKLDLFQLWSDESGLESDQYPFLESSPVGRAVWNGGTVYPTSHVEILYDSILHGNLSDHDQQDIILLFYMLAPIHLVMHRIVANIPVPPIPILLGVYTSLQLHESASYRFDTDWVLRGRFGFGAALGLHESGSLVLNGTTFDKMPLPNP
jgi:hypothetical protein